MTGAPFLLIKFFLHPFSLKGINRVVPKNGGYINKQTLSNHTKGGKKRGGVSSHASQVNLHLNKNKVRRRRLERAAE